MNTRAKIIGRHSEKKEFQKMLESPESEFLVVYGRRRVGKTFMIRNYFKDSIVFDFTGTYNVPRKTQLENFLAQYLDRTNGKKETKPPKNWREAFRYLLEYLKSLSKRKKHVVFIDELPWLDTHKSGIVSALEYFWNQHLSDMDNILLVVCGSATSWMQNKILRSKGGLYNRTTKEIKLNPFTLGETEEFLRSRNINLNKYQIIEIYMAMGGIPHYLKEVNKGKSPTQVIDQVCFSKDGLLYQEYEKLFPSIFNKYENHLNVIEALADKPNGMQRKELIKKSKLPDGGIFTRTIKELVDSEFISIIYPYRKKKRNAIYKLTDMYTLFYSKFIKDQKYKGKGTWEQFSKTPSYVAWSGYAYENIWYKHLHQLKKGLGISGTLSSAASWHFKGNEDLPGTQIDLLLDRDDKVINICEVKFTKDEYLMNKIAADNLRKKTMIFRNVTDTKKSIFNTLITTFPAIKNSHYLGQVQNEINMEILFE